MWEKVVNVANGGGWRDYVHLYVHVHVHVHVCGSLAEQGGRRGDGRGGEGRGGERGGMGELPVVLLVSSAMVTVISEIFSRNCCSLPWPASRSLRDRCSAEHHYVASCTTTSLIPRNSRPLQLRESWNSRPQHVQLGECCNPWTLQLRECWNPRQYTQGHVCTPALATCVSSRNCSWREVLSSERRSTSRSASCRRRKVT